MYGRAWACRHRGMEGVEACKRVCPGVEGTEAIKACRRVCQRVGM